MAECSRAALKKRLQPFQAAPRMTLSRITSLWCIYDTKTTWRGKRGRREMEEREEREERREMERDGGERWRRGKRGKRGKRGRREMEDTCGSDSLLHCCVLFCLVVGSPIFTQTSLYMSRLHPCSPHVSSLLHTHTHTHTHTYTNIHTHTHTLTHSLSY